MSEVRVEGSPSGVYPAAGLQRYFICGFDFAVLGGLWGGGYCGSILSWGWPFPGCVRGGGFVGCVQSRQFGACEPCLPRFILLLSFRDTLLVVSILGYDYHLRAFL